MLFSHGGTRAQRGRFQRAIDGSGDTIAHEGLAEVQEVAQLQPGESQISKQLLLVCRRDAFDRLQLQKDFAFHDQIRAEALGECLSRIFDRNSNLALHIQPMALKRSGQSHLINCLEQPRPQISVQRHSTV